MAKAGSSTVPVLAVVLLAVVLAAASAPRAGAVTCGQVTSSLSPCIPYTRSKVTTMVPPGCCSGVKNLNAAAQTTADRQAVCKCLKSALNTISGIDVGKAAGIPGKCGVSLPYPISTSVDCATVK